MRMLRGRRAWARVGTVLAVCLLLVGCGGKINQKNYDKITTGMSRSDVDALLGPGTELAVADAKSLVPEISNIGPPNFSPGGKGPFPGFPGIKGPGKGGVVPGGPGATSRAPVITGGVFASPNPESPLPKGLTPEGPKAAPEGPKVAPPGPDAKAAWPKGFPGPEGMVPGAKGGLPSPPGIPSFADFQALREGSSSAKWVKYGNDKKFILVGFLNDKVLWKTSKGL